MPYYFLITIFLKAPIIESLFKTEHLETLPKVFYYEFYKVLIDIDICVEHPRKSAYIRKIMQPIPCITLKKMAERTFKILQCLRHKF